MHNVRILQKSCRPVTVLIFICIVLTQVSCKKYLDVRRSQSQAVPTTLKDMQAILDNQYGNSSAPAYLEFVADNYYLFDASWSTSGTEDRLSYVWDKDAQVKSDNWSRPYSSVYNANTVLDYLPAVKINESERSTYNSIKGTALFYRAYSFFNLAQLFCQPYDPATASANPGIVIRLTSAVEKASQRGSVQQTYDQIINDLKEAVELLPETSSYTTRPIKAAALGMLARVSLSMRDYGNAKIYADQTLAKKSALLDYNSLINSSIPGFANNPEILFLSSTFHTLLQPKSSMVDSSLYQSYSSNDLRRDVFFGNNTNGTHYWIGSYMPDDVKYGIFDGIVTDEIYLIRAESKARAGDKDGALDDLNAIMRNRYKTGTFSNITAGNATDALNKILFERRKELLFRGLRWSDLRRFNLEGANITLKRIVNGTTYTLPPNDPRWVLLITAQEISQSGIAQNPR